jgi:photosystem II stability/assembly factor-like uncharacterized protein
MQRIVHALASLLAAGSVLAADEPAAPTSDSSVIAPLASKSLLLDLTRAGARMVTVGERGHVLTSDDQGATWKQSKVPTRATLTGVFFVDDKLGWAVGHDEVILRSDDAGTTWTLTHSAPEKEQPLLDVWFRDANNGFAIGAYGAMLKSSDGGRTWEQRAFEPQPLVPAKPAAKKAAAAQEDEYADATTASDVHLNSVARAPDGKLYIAAEAGNLFRSDDDGETWLSLPSPYEGSFFGILPLDTDSLLAFGLRGHLYRSDDHGRSWNEIGTGTVAMLTSGDKVDVANVVIGGLAGTLLVSRDGGVTFNLNQQVDRKGIAAVLAIDAQHFVVAGEGGVRILTP